MPRGIRGVRRSQELLENIAALAAGMGITASMAMYDVQTEPLEAIAKIAIIHESLGWITNEVSQARQAWEKAGKPDIYTAHQQGHLL